MKPLILVEGWADRLLLLALRFSDREIINQKGKFKIAEAMQDKYQDLKAVAVIDEDKLTANTQSQFLQSFVEREGYSRSYLKMKAHPKNRKHFLIILRPKALEHWSINATAEAKISLADYKLSAEAKELRKRYKRQEIEYDEDVWRFFKALDRNNPSQVQTLRAWIEEVQSVQRP